MVLSKPSSKSVVLRIIQHLRFPFSFFLLPVFVLSLAHEPQINEHWIGIFLILHLLIYPASNGYNSLQDQDKGSIGGIEFPSQVPAAMGWVTLVFDAIALGLVFWLYGLVTALLLLSYITVSRLYSYRGIRLKRFPVIGFLSVTVFQGGSVFLLVNASMGQVAWLDPALWLGVVVASLFIGASYPLTQVYQHDQDKEDGVTTLSYLLGVRGTFLFTALIFALFIGAFSLYAWLRFETILALPLAVLLTTPAAVYLVAWARRVWRDPAQANFRSAMRMTVIGSVSMNFLFLVWFILLFTHQI